MSMTYRELKEAAALSANHNSALHLWRTVHELSEDSPVGPELVGDFDARLETFLAVVRAQAKKGSQSSQVANRKSQMKAFHRLAKSLGPDSGNGIMGEGAVEDRCAVFSRIIREAAAKKGLDATKIRVKILPTSWLEGRRLPRRRSRQKLRDLEIFLGLEPKTLESFLVGNKQREQEQRAPWALKTMEMNRLRYGLSIDEFPKRLASAWNDYVSWRKGTLEGVEPPEHRWTANTQGEWETMRKCAVAFRLFFGFLVLPKDAKEPRQRGLGMSRENLSLVMMSDAKLVKAFIEFTAFRNGGISGYQINSIGLAMTLCRPDNEGLLPQLPGRFLKETGHLGRGAPKTEKTFKKWVNDQYEALRKLNKAFGKQVKVLRDPEAPIRDIIAAEQPMQYVKRAIEVMLKERVNYSGYERAVYEADLMLFVSLAALPLRAYNWRTLPLSQFRWSPGKDRLWVHVGSNEFKTRQHLEDDYDVEIASWAIPYFREYLERWRPMLLGAKAGSKFFYVSHTKANPNCLGSKCLNGRMRKTAIRIMGRSIGIHWMRSVLVTHMAKNHPENYAAAAALLNDSEEIMKEFYAKVKRSQHFGFYNKVAEDIFGKDGDKKK